MRYFAAPLAFVLVAAAAVLASCGDDDTDTTSGDTQVGSSDDTQVDSGAANDGSAMTSDDGSENNAGSGEATLTIGPETWEFDGFICAFGYENTESDVFSFSSNAFGTLADGTRTQLQANIWDDTGSNALSGPDTEHEITFDDIDDFEDPAVNWLMNESELSIDGTQITVEGATFRDLSTGEEQTGSFVGNCGPGSRF